MTSIQAVEISSGKILWTVPPPSGDSFASPPIIVNGIVYIGTASGFLEGYKVTNGTNVVSMNLGQPIFALDTGSAGPPLAGLGAAEDSLVVPASNYVIALSHKP
jgi:outer membrane protein assembly factor BamB